jgi:threonine dehydratase
MRRIATEAKLVAEPSGAVALAGALALDMDPFRTVAVISGGNVDLKTYAEILVG